MTTTLSAHIRTYVNGRRRRGDISALTARNLDSRLATLDRSFGHRPVAQLGRAAVNAWLETIGDLSPATRRAYLSSVKGFCRWLVAEGVVKVDPTKDVERVREPRRVPRSIDVESVATLLAVLPDRRARAIVWLMVGCGLRCVEVERLDEGDYDQRAGTLVVRGKADHERVIPVPAQVAAALEAYRREHGRTTGPMIRHLEHPSRGLDRSTISRYAGRWFRDAGLKTQPYDGRSAHALRHTAASDVLDRCGDVTVVQAMLGHANVATTSVYLRRARLGVMRDAMEGRDYFVGHTAA